MTAALIGLIGIVAGAILGGFANYEVERRKNRALAQAAGRLISGELGIAARRIDSARQTKRWWAGDLPVDMWTKHVGELAFEAEKPVLETLSAAYGIVQSWNIDRAAADPALPLAPQELERDRDKLLDAKELLDRALARLGTSGWGRATRRQLALLAGLVVLGTVVLAVFAAARSRPDVKAATVAQALQSRLGARALVDCDPEGNDWRCTIHRFSGPRDTCLATGAPGAGARRLAVAAVGTRCTEIAKPQQYNATTSGGNVFATPGQAERAAHAGARGCPARRGISVTAVPV